MNRSGLFSALRRLILGIVRTVLLAFILGCLYLFFFQRSMIYFPQPKQIPSPTLSLPTAEGATLVSVRDHDGPDALIYFGGNGEDVSLNLPDFSAAFPNHALYLMHYRGYGGSAGNPSETALMEDALALYERVSSKHRNIVIAGRSLGSGVAVHLASLRPATRLILITPYDSFGALAAQQFPYMPVRWLLQDKFESNRYAPQITAPTLLLMAENDELIPRDSTALLLTRFQPGLATLRTIAGASHNTISEDPQYIVTLKAFLE